MGHDLETLKKLANHKISNSDDVTKGYLIVNVQDMLAPMEKVGNRLCELMIKSAQEGNVVELKKPARKGK